MKIKTGIAMHRNLIRNSRRARAALLSFLTATLLTACGGGAPTSNNPTTIIPDTGQVPYAGPVARDADVLKFQQEFWSNARTSERCGSCHNETVGQQPMFVRNDDVNLAYDEAITVTDVLDPSASRVVAKVGGGHNCWVAAANVCAEIMTTWIENWVGAVSGGGREIVLTAPTSFDPAASRNFPLDPSAFQTLIHAPILVTYCANCHSSETPNAQQPYFADPDIVTAYDAAKPKMNLDAPANSRLVIRLRSEFHNCWNVGCAQSAQIMEDAITAFADGITPTTVNPNLVISKAMHLTDGILASGGNRYEDTQIGLWEFKTGSGLIAYDTSGVDPAIDLNFSGDLTWFGGWGVTINDGKAQGSTSASKKLFDIIQDSGEFTIEAWAIPANVTQDMSRIISYSGGDAARNFTLQQTLYDYDFRLRTTETGLNGDPALSTRSADEVLQATLQHVVATYHPVDGRQIYVNGQLAADVDPIPGGTLVDWQNTFALVFGNETSGAGLWQGTLRLVAIHRRALTAAQVQQNFDVGVGEKFYLLFDISEVIQAAAQSSYILFEVQQFDSFAYLFDKPSFITLDGSQPEGILIEGLRVAMNGLEAPVGQSYATMNDTLSASLFGELGQPLSLLGAVLPLEKGPAGDEFFLTFDRLGGSSYNRPDDPMLVITPTDLPPASHVGLRTFDEINATFAAVTGVDPTLAAVDLTYQELRQSLPAIEDINTFLSAHQVAIAQLSIEYCNALIGSNQVPNPDTATYFPGFDFDAAPATAFAGSNRDLLVIPLINNIVGTNLADQPAFVDVYAEVASFQAAGGRPDNLIDRLVVGGSDTRAISKGVCAAILGSAATLLQ